MTNPPHDDDRQEPVPPEQPVPPAPDYARPPQPEPGSQYGRPATFYGPPSAGQPFYGPPSGGQAGYGSSAPSGQPSYGQPGEGQPPHGPQPYGPPSYGPPSYAQPGYGRPGYGQPPYPAYGQPPFGPPYGQPPARRKRLGLIGVFAGVVILVAGAGLALAFALRSTELDPHAVERDVAAQFQQREGVAVDLDCAEEMSVEKGKSYTCSGVTADDEPVTLKITITDEKSAAYTWTEP
jgi:hypothetical protein